jgi:hypothetical protein
VAGVPGAGGGPVARPDAVPCVVPAGPEPVRVRQPARCAHRAGDVPAHPGAGRLRPAGRPAHGRARRVRLLGGRPAGRQRRPDAHADPLRHLRHPAHPAAGRTAAGPRERHRVPADRPGRSGCRRAGAGLLVRPPAPDPGTAGAAGRRAAVRGAVLRRSLRGRCHGVVLVDRVRRVRQRVHLRWAGLRHLPGDGLRGAAAACLRVRAGLRVRGLLPGAGLLGRPDPLGLPPWAGWCAPAVALAASAAGLAVWRVGVRHYRSTGS